jgi:hypothetical protein
MCYCREADVPFTGKLYVRRTRLNRGGYTEAGRYFGIGAPLYEVSSDRGEIHTWYRAKDRNHAKEQASKEYPACSFYR